jgi:hypothetical protein
VLRRIALVGFIVLAGGCGGSGVVPTVAFVVEGGMSSGPESGAWGDGTSGPSGLHVGCIDGRRFSVLITVHNRTKQSIRLVRAGGPEEAPAVIKRVAVQVRLAPPPPTGDRFVDRLRGWNDDNSPGAEIPAQRDAWIQSNFLMRNCQSLRQGKTLTVNRSTTLTYSAHGAEGTETVTVRGAKIILTRGPLHPSVPINQVG